MKVAVRMWLLVQGQADAALLHPRTLLLALFDVVELVVETCLQSFLLCRELDFVSPHHNYSTNLCILAHERMISLWEYKALKHPFWVVQAFLGMLILGGSPEAI
jgi:isoprenylcysteine carboxyl methyltransferase (ICMT) family protein YpbQ